MICRSFVGVWETCYLIGFSRCCCWSAITRVNVCPFQGSRTIRTEEAVLISLARFSPYLAASGQTNAPSKKAVISSPTGKSTPVVEFSDDRVSDESSDDGSLDSE
jgi:Putative RNA methyltransferase